MSAGRLAWVVLLTGVYLLSLGSLNPLDAAEGLVLATALSLGLRGRLEGRTGRAHHWPAASPPSRSSSAASSPMSSGAPGTSPCGWWVCARSNAPASC